MANLKVVIVVVAAVLGSAIAGPVSLNKARSQCASYCRATDKFLYEPGKTYAYDYETVIESKIHSNSADHATLRMTATAEVSVLAPCEFLLTMHNVQLEERDVSGTYEAEDATDFAAALERFPMRFAFQDGLVESVCPVSDEEETAWVLNIKRGVLSLFQNSMNDFGGSQIVTETDVAGLCETRYDVSSGIYSTTVTKTKDLLTCAERHARLGGLEGVPYANAASKAVNSLPVLQSTHECSQTIRSNRLEKSECKEVHVLAPFKGNGEEDKANTAATTTAVHSLTFSSEKSEVSATVADVQGQTSLLFESNAAPIATDSEIHSVLALVHQIETDTEVAVSPATPRAFSALVARVKSLSKESLARVLTKVQASPRETRILMDAVSLAGTSASIAIMKEQIQNGRMEQEDADSWLTSLAFTSYPTDEMISAVAPLLEESNPSQQALLGISAITHRYCARVPDCAQTSKGVRQVIAALETRLKATCNSGSNLDAALVTLKAIGNVGVMPKNSASLVACIQNEATPMELRVAALQAFRRLPCDDDSLEQTLSNIFADPSKDSELRINAYLSLMRCPSPNLMNEVQAILASEPVNQVGSFVWTHLTNLQETKDPSKQYARDLLSSDFLRNKFQTDVRKFSRNFEGGYIFPGWNVGAQAESNIIFSTKSFVPRSANLNLTAHLFGETVNLLEVGGRVEGLEQVAESLFGENGYWPREEISTVFKGMREKREIHPDELGKYFYDSPKDVSGHAFARIFGNDLMLQTFRNKEELAEQLGALHPKSLLDSVLSGKEIDLTKNIHFLDTDLTIPLASGFPLHLALNGTASLRLIAKGQLDASTWFSSGKAEGSGEFRPSAAIEIHGLVAVGAGKSHRTGMSLKGTIHSSSMISGSFKVEGTKLISTRLDVPWQKMEILELATNVALLRAGRPVAQSIPMDSDAPIMQVCSGETMSRVAGIEACVSVSRPEVVPTGQSEILTADTKLRIFIQKTDIFPSYNFDYSYNVEKTARGPVYSGRVKIDTPGSRQDRTISTHGVLDVPAGLMKWRMQTPVVSAAASGTYTWTKQLKAANMTMDLNEEQLFGFGAQMRTTAQDSGSYLYEPIMHISFGHNSARKPIKVSGRVEASDVKFSSKMSVDGVAWKPITVKASGATRSKNKSFKIKLDGMVDGPHINAEFQASGRSDENGLGYAFSTKYSLAGKTHETLDTTGKISRETTGSLTTRKLTFSLKNSALKSYNTDLDWTMQNSPGHFENTIAANLLNGYQWNVEQFSLVRMSKGLEFETRVSAQCPQLNDLDFGAKIKTQFADDKLTAEGSLKLNKDWEGKTDITFTHVAVPFKVSATGKVSYPGTDMKGEAHVFSGNQGTVSLEMSGASEPDGGRFSAVGTYNDASSELRLDHQLNLEASINNDESISFSSRLRAEGRHSSVSAKFGKGSAIHEMLVTIATKADVAHDVNAQLRGPSYAYIANGKLNLNPEDFAVAVDLDTGNKYAADLKIANSPMQKALDASITWEPEQKVEVNIFASPDKYSATVAYPGQQLEADLSLENEKTILTGSWAPNKQIAITATHFMPSRTEGQLSLEIQTPFEAIKQGKGQVHYNFEGNNLHANIMIQKHGSKIIDMKLDGKQQQTGSNKSFEGDLAMDGSLFQSWGIDSDAQFLLELSPSKSLKATVTGTLSNEHFAVSASAEKLQGKVGASAELEIGSQTIFATKAEYETSPTTSNIDVSLVTSLKTNWAMQASANHDLSGNVKTLGGSVNIATPIPEHEQFATSFNVEVTDNTKLEAKAEIEIPNLHYKLRVNGETTVEGRGRSFNANAAVSGTGLPIDIDIKVEHKFNTSGKKEFNTAVEAGGIMWHPLKIQASGKAGKADTRGNFAVSFLGKSGEGKFRIRREGNNVRVAGMGQYEGDKIEGDLDITYQSSNSFKLEGGIDTPWTEYLPSTKFQASHLSSNNEMKTSGKIEQLETIMFSFNQALTTSQNDWRSTIAITTPWDNAKTMSITNNQENVSGGIQHDFEVMRNGANSQGKLVWKKTGGNIEGQLILSGEAIPMTVQLIGKVNADDLNMEATGLVGIQGLPEYKVGINGRLSEPHGALEVKLQRQQHDVLDVNVNYFIGFPASQAGAKVNVLGHSYLEASLNAELNPMTSESQATISFSGVEFKLAASHDFNSQPAMGSVSAAYNGKQVELKLSASTEEFLISSAKLELETPCDYWHSVAVSINYDIASAKKIFEVGVSRNGNNIMDLQSGIDLGGPLPGGKADVSLTAFWGGQPLLVKIQSTCVTDDNKEYTLRVTVNNHVFTVAGQRQADGVTTFKTNLINTDGNINLGSFDFGLTEFSSSQETGKIWIEGTAGNYAFITKGKIGKTFLHGALSINLEGPTTQYPSAMTLAGEYDFRRPSTASANAAFTMDSNTYSVGIARTESGIDMVLQTPHQHAKHLRLQGTWDQTDDGTTVNLHLHHNEQQSQLSASLTPLKNSQKGAFKITGRNVPFAPEKFAVGAEYDTTEEEKAAKAYMDIGNKLSEIEAKARVALENGEMKLRAALPSLGLDYNDLAASLTFLNGDRHKRAALDLHQGANTANYAAELDLDPDQMSLSALSPHPGYQRMGLVASHKDNKLSIEAQNENVKTVATFSGHANSQNGNAHLVLSTPLFGGIDISFKGNYEQGKSGVSTEFNMKINDFNAQVQGRVMSGQRGSATLELITEHKLLAGSHQISASWDLQSKMKRIQVTIASPQGSHSFVLAGEISNGSIESEISLPIAGWENVRLNGKYKMAEGQEVFAEFQHGLSHYEVQFVSQCSNASSECAVSAGFKSPEAVLGNSAVSFNYKVQGKSSGDAELKANLNGWSAHVRLGANLKPTAGSASFAADSTIDGWESLGVQANYEFPGKGSENLVKVSLKYNENRKDFDARVLVDDADFMLKASTPFRGFSSIETRVSLESEQQSRVLRALFHKESFKASIQAQVKLAQDSGILSVNADVPSVGWVGDGKFIAQYDIATASPRKSVKVGIETHTGIYSGKLTVDASSTKGKIAIVGASPIGINQMPAVNCDVEYDLESTAKTAKVSWRSTDGHESSYGIMADMDASEKNGSLSLKLNAPGNGWWNYANADLTYTTGPGKLVSFALNAVNSKFSIHSDIGTIGHINVVTPLEGYNKNSLAWELDTPKQGQYMAKLQLVLGPTDVDFSVELGSNNNNEYKLDGSIKSRAFLGHPAMLSLKWHPDTQHGHVTANAQWEANSSVTGSANWRFTSTDGFLSANYNSEMTGSGSTKIDYNMSANNIDIDMQIGKSVAFQFKGQAGASEASLKLNVQSPLSGKLQAEFAYDVKSQKKSVLGMVNLEGIRYELDAVLDAVNPFKVNGNININAGQFAAYQMRIDYDLRHASTNKTVDLLLNLGKYGHFGIDGSVERQGTRQASLKLNIKSSHVALSDIRLVADIDFNQTPTGKLVLQWTPSDSIDAAFNLQHSTWKQCKLDVSVQAPFASLENFQIKADWNLASNQQKSGSLELQLNEDTYSVSASVTNTAETIAVDLTTILSAKRNEFKMQLSKANKTFALNTNIDGQKLTIDAAMSDFTLQQIGLKAALVSTIKAISNQRQEANFVFTSQISSSKSSLNLEAAFNGKEIQASGGFDISSSHNGSYNVDIRSPFQVLRSFSAEASIEKDSGSITATLHSLAGVPQIFRATYSSNAQSHSIRVETPFQGYTDISAHVNLGNDEELKANFRYGNGQEIKLIGQYDFTHAASVNATINSPIGNIAIKSFLEAGYAFVSGILDDKEVTVVTHWKKPLDAEIKITTPWSPYESVFAKVNFGTESNEDSTSVNGHATLNDRSWGIVAALQKSQFAHKIQGRASWGDDSITLEVSLAKRDDEFDAKFEARSSLFDAVAFHAVVSTDWTPNNRMNYLNASIKVKMPIEDWQEVEGRIMARTSEELVEAEFMGRRETREISGKLSLGQKDAGSYKLKMETVLPTMDLDGIFRSSIYGSLKVNDDWTRGSADIRGSFGDSGSDEHVAKIDFDFTSGSNKISFHLDTNITQSKIIDVALEQTHTQDGKMDAEFKAKIGQETYNAKLFWSITSNSVKIQAMDDAISKLLVFSPTEISLTASLFSKRSADGAVELLLDGKKHSVSGKYNLDKTSFSAEGELVSPKLDTERKSFKLHAKYPTNESLDLLATVTGATSHSAGFMYESKTGGFALKSTGFIDIPGSKRAEYDINVDKKSLLVKIMTPTAQHQAKATWDLTTQRGDLTLETDSPLTGGNMRFSALFRQNSQTSAEASIECACGGSTSSVGFEMEFSATHLTGSLTAHVPQLGLNGQILKINGMSTGTGIDGEVELRAFGRHRAHATIRGLAGGEMALFSTAIPSDSIRVSYQLVIGQSSSDSSGSASLIMGENEYSVAYDASASSWKDMRGSVSIKTPWEIMPSAELTAKLQTADGFLMDIDLKSGSVIVPAAGVSAKLRWDPDFIDASFRVTSPVKNFETVTLLINLPMHGPSSDSDKKFEPRLTLSTPKARFAVNAAIKNAADKGTFEAEVSWPGEALRVSAHLKKVSPYAFRMEAATPFVGYERITLNTELNLGFPQDGHAFASLKFNDKPAYEGTVALKIQPGMYKIVVDVNTPWEKHNYGITLRLEKTDRKTVHVEFQYPGSTIGAELDYVFSSWNNLVAKVALKTPYQGFEEIALSLVHQLDFPESMSYTGELGASLGMINKFLLAVKTNIDDDSSDATAKFIFKENKFVGTAFHKKFGNHESAQVEAQSSWNKLRSFKLAVSSASDDSESNAYSGLLSLNDETLFSVTLNQLGESSHEIQLVTPWRSMSGKSVWKLTDVTTAEVQFCWNTKAIQESTIAFAVNIQGTSFGKTGYIEITTPSRSVTLQGDYALTSLKFQHSMQLSWRRNKFIGYKILLKNTSDYTQKSYAGEIELMMPKFPVSVSGAAKLVGSDVSINGNFNYHDHVSKFSAAYSDHGSWNAENRVLNIFLVHPLADAPLSLQSEFSRADGVTNLRAKIEYSDDKNKDIVFQYTDDASYRIAGLGSDEIHPRKISVAVSHPSTDLDIKTEVAYGSGKNERAASFKGSYLDRFKNMRTLVLEGNVMPDDTKASLKLEMDGESMKLDGILRKEPGFQAQLSSQRGLRTPFAYSLSVNPEMPFAELNMDYGPSRTLTLAGGLPSEREAKLSVSRSTFGNEATDAILLAKLNSSHIFHSKLNWKPQFWNDAMDEVKYRMEFLKQEFSVTLGDIEAFWMGELEHHFNGLPEAIKEQANLIADSLVQEIHEIEDYIIRMKKEVQELFDANSFFLKDITAILNFFHGHTSNMLNGYTRVVRAAVNKVGDLASGLVVQIKDGVIVGIETAGNTMEAVNKLAEQAYDHASKAIVHISGNWDKLSDEVDEWISAKFDAIDSALQAQIEALIGTYKQTLTELYKLSKQAGQWMQDYAETVQDFAKDYQQAAAKHPALASVLQVYNDYASWLEEWHFSEYAVEFKDKLSVVIDKMMQDLDSWTHEYKEYVSLGKQLAQGHYDELKQIPMVGYVTETVSRLYNSMEWAWRYYELEQMIRTNMRTLIKLAQEQSTALAIGLTTGHPAPWDLAHNYVWDPAHGRIEVTQQHPFKWTSFRQAPELDTELVSKLEKAFDSMDMNTQWHKFLDTVTSSREKLLSVASVIPPFHAYAILAGNGHYVTFDGRAFEFLGACSYTLLHDPRHKFSIVVDYDASSNGPVKRESLRLIRGENEIRIGSDYKVTLNSKNVDLPWRSSDGVTIRRQSGKITVDNGHGINLECLVAWDACTVSVSGWHFARTRGLLGTFNNEPSDDFMAPNGSVMPTVEAFADSWRLDTAGCQRSKSAHVPGPFPLLTAGDKAACDALFASRDSALSPCFPKLSVEAFKAMCHEDVSNMDNMPNAKEATCTSAAAYVSACRAEGMDIWMPPQCVKCELEDKKVIMAAESIEVLKSQAPAATDIVLAIDHGGCVTSEQVAGMVHNLDAELVAAGSLENKFTMVGYNGETPRDKPHVQTSEGSIWVKAASFKRAIEMNGVGSAGMEVATVHDAVQFAARLPFRAGVGKAMILISCHSCGVEDTTTYADTLSMLHERNIAFHYITPNPISLKSDKKDALWPVGFDARAAYTLKDARKMVGDSQLKAQIQVPKDLCVPLALETNGTVFSLEVFSTAAPTANRATRAKKFYSVIAKRVVESAQPPECQRCDCVADHSGLGTTQCQPCLPVHLDKFVQDYNRMRYDVDQSKTK